MLICSIISVERNQWVEFSSHKLFPFSFQIHFETLDARISSMLRSDKSTLPV